MNDREPVTAILILEQQIAALADRVKKLEAREEIEAHLTVSEVAKALRCSPTGLYKALALRQVDHLRPVRVLSRWLFPIKALHEALAAGASVEPERKGA